MAVGASVVVEVSAEAEVVGEEDLVVGEVVVETLTSGQETGRARTQAVGTCALRGGRSATNATNPGAAAASSTQPGVGEDMPGVEAGAAGSFPGTKNLGILREIPNPGNCFLPKHRRERGNYHYLLS